jgi:cyclomaltodextrinase
VEIAPAGADVWGFELDVTATWRGPGPCWFSSETGKSPTAPTGDSFTARVSLAPGPNSVTAVCRDASGGDHRSVTVVYVGKLPDTPKARARLRLDGETLTLDGSKSSLAEHSRARLSRFEWFVQRGLGDSPRTLGEGTTIRTPRPALDGEYSYQLRVSDVRGASDRSVVGLDVHGRALRVDDREEGALTTSTTPGVVYGVVPELYGSPPLRAVLDALPAIAELGVSALWLSPLFESPAGDFGYAVTDYFKVRREYGTTEDLRELVAAAHRRGLRVLLDFVPNHTSDEHPYFRQAAELGTRSHYFRFYERTDGSLPAHYFDWTNLPNLSYENPEVRRWMIAAADHWVREANIDGYRVDAAWGIRRREPSFFPELAEELSRLSPRTFLLAEAPASDPYYVENGFQAAYDWSRELGHPAWEHVFDRPEGIAGRLESAIRPTVQSEKTQSVFRFLNNNDTGARFITRHGMGLTKVATVLLLTLPGVPSLFCFDEGGAEFEPYAARGKVARAPHPELIAFHRELIRLRRTVPALHGPDYGSIYVGQTDEGYAYERRARGAPGAVVVALNFGADHVSIPLAGSLRSRPRVLFASDGVAVTGSSAVGLGPFGYAVLFSE